MSSRICTNLLYIWILQIFWKWIFRQISENFKSKNIYRLNLLKSVNSSKLSFLWFFLENDILGFKMKIWKFVGIKPIHIWFIFLLKWFFSSIRTWKTVLLKWWTQNQINISLFYLNKSLKMDRRNILWTSTKKHFLSDSKKNSSQSIQFS